MTIRSSRDRHALGRRIIKNRPPDAIVRTLTHWVGPRFEGWCQVHDLPEADGIATPSHPGSGEELGECRLPPGAPGRQDTGRCFAAPTRPPWRNGDRSTAIHEVCSSGWDTPNQETWTAVRPSNTSASLGSPHSGTQYRTRVWFHNAHGWSTPNAWATARSR